MTAGLILLAELLFSKIEYHIMATAPEINLFVEYKDRSALDRVLKLYRDKLIKVPIWKLPVNRIVGRIMPPVHSLPCA